MNPKKNYMYTRMSTNFLFPVADYGGLTSFRHERPSPRILTDRVHFFISLAVVSMEVFVLSSILSLYVSLCRQNLTEVHVNVVIMSLPRGRISDTTYHTSFGLLHESLRGNTFFF